MMGAYCLHGRVGVGHHDHDEAMEAGGRGRGTIEGWVFSPTRQLVRLSHLNMPFFQNSEFIWNTIIVPVGKQ